MVIKATIITVLFAEMYVNVFFCDEVFVPVSYTHLTLPTMAVV